MSTAEATKKDLNIKFNDLSKQWEDIREVAEPRLSVFFESGYYIGGGEVEEFEKAFARYTRSKYAIGCSNGTDGLKLAIEAMGVVNKITHYNGAVNVIIPANTYIADVYAVKHQNNANYVITLIDHDEFFQIDVDKLEAHLEESKNAYVNTIIMPVHLYGHPCDMSRIMELAKKYNCLVLEDASQAHGAYTSEAKMVGSYGDACVYSLYPGKNLGAMGDAGIITTNNKEIYERLLPMRNLGCVKKYEHDVDGWNNRLDSIQAIVLKEKLKHLDNWNFARGNLASVYNHQLRKVKEIKTPKMASYAKNHVYHIYCILAERRDELQKFLSENGVPTVIHYPIPIEKSLCNSGMRVHYENTNTLESAGKLLSLPMHPYMSAEQVEHVVNTIKEFYSD